jgi:RsiW-degrading membrane proteinase PrsW (M82 family)
MVFVGLLLGLLFVTPCVVVYGLFIKGIDRYEPEPWWMLGVLFLWGSLVSTIAAGIVSVVGQAALAAAAGASFSDPVVGLVGATVIAPVTEETAKAIGLLLLWGVSAWRYKDLDGALDGAIYGGVVGLGFTLTEDVLYVARAMAEQGFQGFAALFFVRTILAGLAHASFTALFGLGVGIAAESRSAAVKVFAPMLGWCGAVALHAVHNALVTVFLEGGAGFVAKVLLFWLIDGGYFVLLVALVIRDRGIVLAGLRDEVGRTIHAFELERTTSLWMFVPFWNYASLANSPGGYRAARTKQLSLVDLAFLKRRKARGERGVDAMEHRLRYQLAAANHMGVLVGRG